MHKAIAVRRASHIRAIFTKKPLRKWLDEQPRSALTYDKNIERREDVGWTNEDFLMESRKRGIATKYGTILKWCVGVVPNYNYRTQLEKAFKGIKFTHRPEAGQGD